ncbi:hypothetical protein BJX61DRAFT_146672 [Aspergillus egyptiacus]|nr:hypothetical protein BJX61DRAFT_146672 [Aspergillus egyptiacus]
MAGLLSVIPTLFSFILISPIYYVTKCAYFFLALLLSPFIYLGSWVLWVLLLPVRVLIQLKALLIYLGVASLTGASLGLLLYFITTYVLDHIWDSFWKLSSNTRLRSRPEEGAIEGPKSTSANGSDVNNGLWADWGLGLDGGPSKKSGLLSETILEEDSQESELDRRP